MVGENQVPAPYRTIMIEEEKKFEEGAVVEAAKAIPDTSKIPLLDQRLWLRIPDVICVFVDMKNSTKLSANTHDKSTASIYQLFTGTAVRIFDEAESPYIDVKGDGVFALFNSWQPHRALAAAVTFKTFAEEVFIPKVKPKVDVDLAAHIGVDMRTVLVRKIGLKRIDGRTDRQNEVWAGKPVNMAAKLASLSKSKELLVSDRFYKKLTNDKALKSCGCPDSKPALLWKEVDLSSNALFDFDRGHMLTSTWCAKHGASYCNALLAADKDEE